MLPCRLRETTKIFISPEVVSAFLIITVMFFNNIYGRSAKYSLELFKRICPGVITTWRGIVSYGGSRQYQELARNVSTRLEDLLLKIVAPLIPEVWRHFKIRINDLPLSSWFTFPLLPSSFIYPTLSSAVTENSRFHVSSWLWLFYTAVSMGLAHGQIPHKVQLFFLKWIVCEEPFLDGIPFLYGLEWCGNNSQRDNRIMLGRVTKLFWRKFSSKSCWVLEETCLIKYMQDYVQSQQQTG